AILFASNAWARHSLDKLQGRRCLCAFHSPFPQPDNQSSIKGNLNGARQETHPLDRLGVARPLTRFAGPLGAAVQSRPDKTSRSAASQCCSASPSGYPLTIHIS